ncbi:hypothetical protein RRG08_043545 [Elysia crispata]|uniref:Uncharacterized protein n=1 Tax=Elysia crispata TaxID=231223 RepID=A0AAE0YFL1_9GAST|nr:hypothetical protein RRG08_043545 [Elysia crispata]
MFSGEAYVNGPVRAKREPKANHCFPPECSPRSQDPLLLVTTTRTRWVTDRWRGAYSGRSRGGGTLATIAANNGTHWATVRYRLPLGPAHNPILIEPRACPHREPEPMRWDLPTKGKPVSQRFAHPALLISPRLAEGRKPDRKRVVKPRNLVISVCFRAVRSIPVEKADFSSCPVISCCQSKISRLTASPAPATDY